MHELQDYIDAQNGGPGKGWFRIVTDPFQARQVINAGQARGRHGHRGLQLFDCGVQQRRSRVHGRSRSTSSSTRSTTLGVREMELVNKFDNALAGVAGDSGTTGVVVNAGNCLETGSFWEMSHVRRATTTPRTARSPRRPALDRDALAGTILTRFGADRAPRPLYAGARTATRGLTALGEHLVKRDDRQGMIFDPDHMSVRGAPAAARPRREARATPASSRATPGARRTPSRGSTRSAASSRRTPGATKDFVEKWREEQVAARPALLLGRRLRRRHERLRRPGRPAQRAGPGDLPVQVLRRR